MVSKVLNSYRNRRTVSVIVSIFLASMVAHYFSFTHTAWIIIAALMINHIGRVAHVRQTLFFFLVMTIAILIASLILDYRPLLSLLSLFLLWLISDILIRYRYSQFKIKLSAIFLFYVAYAITVYVQGVSMQTLRYQMLDVLIGSIIGLITMFIILPPKIIKDFNDGINILIHKLEVNTLLLTRYFENKTSLNEVILATDQVDATLSDCNSAYPDWVYDTGFNRELRGGFRFYLVTLDRVIEILHSINVMLPEFDALLFEDMLPYFEKSMLINHKILSSLHHYFAHGKKDNLTLDWKEDIVALEKTIQDFFPASEELIEISPQFYIVTALLREIKDLRRLLLDLLLALP